MRLTFLLLEEGLEDLDLQLVKNLIITLVQKLKELWRGVSQELDKGASFQIILKGWRGSRSKILLQNMTIMTLQLRSKQKMQSRPLGLI